MCSFARSVELHGTSLDGVGEGLQHQHAGPFTHHEAAPLQVERSGGGGGVVVAHGVHGHEVAEAGEGQRSQRRLRAPCETLRTMMVKCFWMQVGIMACEHHNSTAIVEVPAIITSASPLRISRSASPSA